MVMVDLDALHVDEHREDGFGGVNAAVNIIAVVSACAGGSRLGRVHNSIALSTTSTLVRSCCRARQTLRRRRHCHWRRRCC